jgi:hypothetical protein
MMAMTGETKLKTFSMLMYNILSIENKLKNLEIGHLKGQFEVSFSLLW